jgi:hypothetical protein
MSVCLLVKREKDIPLGFTILNMEILKILENLHNKSLKSLSEV